MGKETWNWRMAATWLGTGNMVSDMETLFSFKYLDFKKRFHGKENLELETLFSNKYLSI